MHRFRFLLASGLVAVSAFFLFAADGPPAAEAKGKKDAHLRYVATWGEAVKQARARNAILFATFHKDK